MISENRINLIITKYLKGESTREELLEAISYFESQGLNQTIENQLNEIWEDDQFMIGGQCETKNIGTILTRIHEKIKPEMRVIRKRKIRQLVIYFSRVAAFLIIGLSVGLLFSLLKKEEPVVFTAMSPRGSISQIILPDSTLVYLNSDTELKYSGSRRKREVFLNGEAWFRVKEDNKSSFIVRNDIYDVYVSGTAFNVRAYKGDKEVVTTLESGSVTIPSSDKFRLRSPITLEPGQQFIYDGESNTIRSQRVRTALYTAWKDNRLIFINMNLAELIKLLERRYGVNIEVSDTDILKYHYDGTIKNESILEVMELIKATMPIEYHISNQKIIITNNGGQKMR